MRVASFFLNGETLHFEPPIETSAAPLHSLGDLVVAAVIQPEASDETRRKGQVWARNHLEPYEGDTQETARALAWMLAGRHEVTLG